MGFFDDQVRIKLAGQEIPIREKYTVRSGILEVPAKWDVTVGHGGMLAELIANYEPQTPFELLIGDTSVMVGEVDDPSVPSMASNTLELSGRDYLARLHDTQILDERTFSEKTYTELTKFALKEVGLADRSLFALNAANRKAITGRDSVELEKKVVADQTETGTAGDHETVEVDRTIKGEVGTTWLEFLVQQYRRAGLFLWSDHAGNFILSQPDGAQKPLYRLVNGRGSQSNEVTVTARAWHRRTEQRFTEYLVVGRAGGGKHGRTTILGRVFDDEMIAWWNKNLADRADGGKRRKPKIFRDHHVRTPEQAKFVALRLRAEGRRNGEQLTYTVAGHSTLAIGGGRAVWQPDTTVEVIDDELGIDGPMYLESVTFSQEPMQAQLHLMRIEDLLFAEEPPEVTKKRPKLQTRRGVTTVARVVDSTPGGPAVWLTDPNVAIGAKVQIDPDNEDNLTQTTDVTLKPFTGAEPSGVIHDDPADVPKKPTR